MRRISRIVHRAGRDRAGPAGRRRCRRRPSRGHEPRSGFPENRNVHRQQLLLLQQRPARPSQPAGKGRRSRAQAGLSHHHGDDRRLRLRLARCRELFPAQRRRLLFVRRPQQRRLQQARQVVRRRGHDGLQPVPDPSEAQVGVHRLCQEGQRHRPRPWREAGVLHVLGLCRQAGDDRATGGGLYGRRQCQQRAGDLRPASPSRAPGTSSRNSISMRRTSAIRASPAPISPPARRLRR